MLAAAIRSGEQRIFAIEGDRPDGALDDVGIDLAGGSPTRRAPTHRPLVGDAEI
jgi:hypothetical protein